MRSLVTVLCAGLLAAPAAALAHEEGQQAAGGAAQVRLGKVHFATSCDRDVARTFDTALALLHSFWVREAIEGFDLVLKRDPQCAIAYWGIAMALQQNPLTGQPPTAQTTKAAIEALDKAKAIGAKTQRERDYLAAIELIYRDGETPFRARRLAYEKAMEQLAQRYPDDTEAAIFHALSLDMSADLTDKTYANQLKAAQILERLFREQPEHPGVAHYLIHSYDYPPIAHRGLDAARRYSQIAPDNPHALHMPSHIYTHTGAWQESIEMNRRSAAAAKAEMNGQEQAHATDYLIYAHLQGAEDEEARRLLDEARSINVNTAVFIGPYALAAMPARFALERRAWQEAAALEPQETRFPFTAAITHFARGLGLARTGNVAGAQAEAARLGALRDALREQKNSYWANQVEVQRLAVAAWAALAQGASQEALAGMQAAANLEESMDKHIVTPGPVVPARELLGEMLLDLKRPAEALAAFEASAQREPNRFRGLYGAGQAAALANERAKATQYYQRLTKLTGNSGASRPELRSVRAYLAQR
ncbi:MAG TPA: hypothetical protein VGP97_15685 [Burkholderiales bacterium]|jgi:hypothetical protein|nr:hypothetical protein [Burkholderiales bacterium]